MGALATGPPLLPKGYVAGTITISAGQAGTPQSLLALVQAQLDPNVNVNPYRVWVQSDTSGNLYLGSQTNLVGNLSASNYGVFLPTATATFTPFREYESVFPGANATFGDLYVFMSSSGTFHVEVQ